MSEAKSSNDLAGERTDLALDRTAMAANRTLMAWVRTALSLISFGFTIYKFLEAVVRNQGFRLMREQGPKRLGLLLITLGTLAALMGAIEYVQEMQALNRLTPTPRRIVNFSVVMSLLIGLLGLFLFITIVTNREFF